MSRLKVVKPNEATGHTKALYDGIIGAIGMVPNIHQGLANSPAALEGLLQIEGILQKGTLTSAEVESIKLAVSETYGCTYCLAAHTLIGKKAGLSDSEAINVRRGAASLPKLAALIRFVNKAIEPKGKISDADLNDVKSVGYTDGQIAETLLVIGETVFTNLFNRVHQTTLDFPPAPAL